MNHTPYAVDRYVIDTLMADLVGHDHRPSAFLVYLAVIAAEANGRAALSHAELAERTGLAKRTVQLALGALRRRHLITVHKRGSTDIPEYRALSPWRR